MYTSTAAHIRDMAHKIAYDADPPYVVLDDSHVNIRTDHYEEIIDELRQTICGTTQNSR